MTKLFRGKRTLIRFAIILSCLLVPVLCDAALSGSTTPGETVIDGVPGYLWRHGCDPTAAGMVLAYWDTHGYSKLIPGDSSTQTAEVNQAIASDEHYSDYAQPIDTEATGILADNSELGATHASNCIADFMGTSQSASNLLYGWSTSELVDDALLAYTIFVNVSNDVWYDAASQLYYHSSFTFEEFKAQIDQNRPMVFIVDSDADGESDHGVAAVGYRETNGYPEYACWDTWSDSTLRWSKFQSLGVGKSYGIYLAFSYVIISDPEPEEPDDPDPSCGSAGLLIILTIFAGFGFVSTERK